MRSKHSSRSPASVFRIGWVGDSPVRPRPGAKSQRTKALPWPVEDQVEKADLLTVPVGLAVRRSCLKEATLSPANSSTSSVKNTSVLEASLDLECVENILPETTKPVPKKRKRAVQRKSPAVNAVGGERAKYRRSARIEGLNRANAALTALQQILQTQAPLTPAGVSPKQFSLNSTATDDDSVFADRSFILASQAIVDKILTTENGINANGSPLLSQLQLSRPKARLLSSQKRYRYSSEDRHSFSSNEGGGQNSPLLLNLPSPMGFSTPTGHCAAATRQKQRLLTAASTPSPIKPSDRARTCHKLPLFSNKNNNSNNTPAAFRFEPSLQKAATKSSNRVGILKNSTTIVQSVKLAEDACTSTSEAACAHKLATEKLNHESRGQNGECNLENTVSASGSQESRKSCTTIFTPHRKRTKQNQQSKEGLRCYFLRNSQNRSNSEIQDAHHKQFQLKKQHPAMKKVENSTRISIGRELIHSGAVGLSCFSESLSFNDSTTDEMLAQIALDENNTEEKKSQNPEGCADFVPVSAMLKKERHSDLCKEESEKKNCNHVNNNNSSAEEDSLLCCLELIDKAVASRYPEYAAVK